MPKFFNTPVPPKGPSDSERLAALDEELKKKEELIAKLKSDHASDILTLKASIETKHALELLAFKNALEAKHSEAIAELEAKHAEKLSLIKVSNTEEITKLQEENASLTSKIEELNKKIEGLNKKIEGLNKKIETASSFIFTDEQKSKVSLPLCAYDIASQVLAKFNKSKTLHELDIRLHFELDGKPMTWFAALNNDFNDTDEFNLDVNFEFLSDESNDMTFKLKREHETPITIEKVLSILKDMKLHIINENETVFIAEHEVETPSSFDMIITNASVVF